MRDVVSILGDQNLKHRLCATEYIILAKYVPALLSIDFRPDSMVLRSRAVRSILDSHHQNHEL